MTTRWYTKDPTSDITWKETRNLAISSNEDQQELLEDFKEHIDEVGRVTPTAEQKKQYDTYVANGTWNQAAVDIVMQNAGLMSLPSDDFIKNDHTTVYDPTQIIVKMPLATWLQDISGSDPGSAKTSEEVTENIGTAAGSLPPTIEQGSTETAAIEKLHGLLLEKTKVGPGVEALLDGHQYTLPQDQANKIFGKHTKYAVHSYQTKVGIGGTEYENFIVGPKTWAKLLGLPAPPSPNTNPAEQVAEVIGVPDGVVIDGGNWSPDDGGTGTASAIGRFDPEKFDDDDFDDKVVKLARDIYIQNECFVPNLKTIAPNLYEDILGFIFVTRNFFVTTGAAEAGATISFQLVYVPDPGFERALEDVLTPDPNLEPGAAIEFRAWDFLQTDNPSKNPIMKMKKVLEKAAFTNNQLTEKYDFNFDGLKTELEEMRVALHERFYGPNFPAYTRLHDKWEGQRVLAEHAPNADPLPSPVASKPDPTPPPQTELQKLQEKVNDLKEDKAQAKEKSNVKKASFDNAENFFEDKREEYEDENDDEFKDTPTGKNMLIEIDTLEKAWDNQHDIFLELQKELFDAEEAVREYEKGHPTNPASAEPPATETPPDPNDLEAVKKDLITKKQVIRLEFVDYPGSEGSDSDMVGQNVDDLLAEDNELAFETILSYYKTNEEFEGTATTPAGGDEFAFDEDSEVGEIQKPDPNFPFYKWKDGIVYVPGYQNLNQFSIELKWLIYHGFEFNKAYDEADGDIDVHNLVEEWIKPTPRKLPLSDEALAVLLDGRPGYKTNEDLQKEMLSAEKRAAIHAITANQYHQIGDAAFLNVVQNSHKIKTVEDVYKYVLHAIPLNSIILTAVQCVTKYMPNTNWKSKVCNIILGNLEFSELDKLLAHMGTDSNSQAYKLRSKIIKATGPHTAPSDSSYAGPAKNAMKQELIRSFQNDLDAKDTLCLAIFAAIPAAVYLLSDLENAEKKLKALYEQGIENPAEQYYEQIKHKINNYKVLAITVDWGNMMKNTIMTFIEQSIVLAVKKILDEISFLCGDSAKADFANMGDDTNISSLNMPPTFPLTASVAAAISDKSVYDDLGSFLGAGMPKGLLSDFLNALGDLLTISELCTLLSTDVPAVNKKVVLDKVWFGVLGLKKYLPIKKAIKNRSRLKKFFIILGKKTSQEYCINSLKNLENTKKMLSDLCGPVSNQALINDLKKKISDDAIQHMLCQEEAIADDLLDTIHKLKNPQAPPIFCGPDSKDNRRKPIFASQQHPSEKYLNNKFLDKTFEGITLAFEKDIGFYKPILTTNGLAEFSNASGQVAGAMAKLYGDIGGKDEDGNDKFRLKDKDGKVIPKRGPDQLDKIMTANAFAARKVHYALSYANVGVDIDTNATEEGTNYLKISTDNKIDATDIINLKLNFGSKEKDGVPAETSRLEFGREWDPVRLDNKLFSNNVYDPTTIISEMINSFNTNNSYDGIVKSVVTPGIQFYSLILEQILKEHAEYISDHGLFKRSVFDQLMLQKESICDVSIFDYEKILQDVGPNADLLQCAIPAAATPTNQEIAQIHAFVELAIKVVIIQEFLKSLMVFSSFGINALMPENDDSFYYKYLADQIINKLGTNIKSYIYKYSRLIYAVKYNFDLDTVSWEQVAENIIGRHMSDVQLAISTKLSKLDLDVYTPGIQSISDFGDTAFGVSEDDKFNKVSKQILRNITTPKLFEPPPILGVKEADKRVVIPAGFYSSNRRLKNGGFFVEEGFEVLHKYKGDVGVFKNEDYDDLTKKVFKSGDTTHSFKSGLDSLIYNSTLGKTLFGSTSGEPSYKINFPDLTEEQLIELSEFEGKISKTTAQIYYAALHNIKPALGLYIPDIADNSLVLKNVHSALTWTKDNAYNKYFKKYSYYKSLNLLIPVIINAGGSNEGLKQANKDINNILIERYYSLMNNTSDASTADKKGFIESALDRKYFLEEESDAAALGSEGTVVYFKLPLFTFYDDKTAAQSSGYNVSNLSLQGLKAGAIPSNSAELDAAYKNLLVVQKKLHADLIAAEKNPINQLLSTSTSALMAYVPPYYQGPPQKGVMALVEYYMWESWDIGYPNQKFPRKAKPFQWWGKKDQQSLVMKTGQTLPPFSQISRTEWMLKSKRDPMNGPGLNYPIGWSRIHSKWSDPRGQSILTIINLATGELYNDPGAEYIKETFWTKPIAYAQGGYGPPHKLTVEVNSKTGYHKPDAVTVIYTGHQWLIVETPEYAKALKQVWDIIHLFDVKDYDEEFPIGSPETSLERALAKADALKALKDIKVRAKGGWNTYNGNIDADWNDLPYKMYQLFGNRGDKAIPGIIFESNRSHKDAPIWKKNAIILAVETEYTAAVGKAADDYAVAYAEVISQVEKAFSDAILDEIGKDERFKAFSTSIQYKSLLSFLAIMVAETTERKYSQLGSMFDGTLKAIQAALNAQLTTSNRGNDPNFYQKSSFNTQDPSANGADMNWVPVILKALVKSLANTADPTWKTPWFFPGPLTPVGIVAKILDGFGEDGGSGNATKDIEAAQDIKCPPDEGNS